MHPPFLYLPSHHYNPSIVLATLTHDVAGCYQTHGGEPGMGQLQCERLALHRAGEEEEEGRHCEGEGSWERSQWGKSGGSRGQLTQGDTAGIK